MKKLASIDIGSNSILLLVAEVNQGKIIKELANESVVTGLGRDLDKNKKFIDQAMDDSFLALKNYAEIIQSLGLFTKDTIITATEASRVALNAPDFYRKIKAELGFSVKIISAAGEAHYSALGAALDLSGDHAVIMDIGGASTELIKLKLKPFKIEKFISMPMGAVRGTDWKNENIFDQKLEQIFQDFRSELLFFTTETLCCVAGTMTSVANIFHNNKAFVEEMVHGTTINKENFKALNEKIKILGQEELNLKFPFLGKRARTVWAGAEVGLRVMDKIGAKNAWISTYGLRYGTIINEGVADEFVTKQY